MTVRKIVFNCFISVVIVMTLSACSQKVVVSAIGPDGNLTVLDPSTNAGNKFAKSIANGEWIIGGSPAPAALVITQYQSTPALKFSSLGGKFSIVRPIEANLVATPFLDWSWNIAQHEPPYHGVSMMIGIRAPEGSIHSTSPSLAPRISGTAEANRIISIRWSQSTLERGNLSRHPSSPDNSVIYTARGGTENVNMWWRESIDLSDIYGKVWPDEEQINARIVFIALINNNTEPNSPAYFSTIKLFR